jgi:hypothetical protein
MLLLLICSAAAVVGGRTGGQSRPTTILSVFWVERSGDNIELEFMLEILVV